MSIPLNIDVQQILLHLANFAILFIILYLVLYKPVKNFMAKRVQYYENMEKEANDKLASATEKEVEYKKLLEDAAKETEALRAEKLKADEAEAEEKRKEAKQQAEKIIEDARNAAKVEHDKIIADAQDEIEKEALAVAKKLASDDPYEQFLKLAEKGEGSN